MRTIGLVIAIFCKLMVMGQSNYDRWIPKAEAGDPEYQCIVANCLLYGNGVEKSIQKAIEWYTKAVDQGNVSAMNSLAFIYSKGEDIKKDPKKAAELYLKAATLGNSDAQWSIALCYKDGDGVEKDWGQAFNWMKKCAESGNDNGIKYLGDFYFNGVGVERDIKKAYECYMKLSNLSISQGDVQNNIGAYYMETHQYQEAISCFEKALASGNRIDAEVARKYLGDCYFNGFGVKKDLKKAKSYYSQSSTQGSAKGLADCFFAEKDYENATKWYKKAAKAKDGESQKMLADCYFNGWGVQQDYTEATYWYKKALASGIKSAETGLAMAKQKSEENKPVPQNLQSRTETEELAPVKRAAKEQVNVDEGIPSSREKNKDLYVVAIGNEKYRYEASVPFAENDVHIFREYCLKTLGVPDNQIRYVENAGYNDLRMAVNWLKQAMNVNQGNGRIIFYYAGHGIPDEADKTAYLLPVDGMGSDVESAYSLTKLYQSLGQMPSKSVVVLLDACFSGSKREGGMMDSARGVAIKVKETDPTGKMVVFSAAKDDETAYPFKSQKHGMFTYFLLKKLQETAGDVKLGELGDYISKEVQRLSFVENGKTQTPTVTSSADIRTVWREYKLK